MRRSLVLEDYTVVKSTGGPDSPWRRLPGDARFGRLEQGLALGLYLGRVVAESSALPWRLRALIPLVLVGIAVGVALAALLARVWRNVWPLSFLWLYVLCPWASQPVALGVAFVAAAVLLAQNVRVGMDGLGPEVAAAGLAMTLYLSTLAPSVLPADSGEFQLVSAVLGIAHPPGYPLYTLVGKLFSLIPVGDVAYRLNLYGAVCASLTLGITVRTVRRATGSTGAALLAAGALAWAPTYWAQATTANIRSLTALLTALSLDTLLHWGETRTRRDLILFGLCFGLGIGHHASLALLGLPFAVYLLVSAPDLLKHQRQWLWALAAFLGSFAVLAYLPIRSGMGAPFDPQPIRDWASFVDHILARGFRGDMLYFRSWPRLVARARVWSEIMALQFGPGLAIAMLGAAVPVWVHKRCSLIPLLGAWAVNGLSAITYRAPQTVEYLIPSYVSMAMLFGYGVGLAQPRIRRQAALRVLLASVLGLLVLANLTANYGSFRELHRDTSTREYAEEILRDAPTDALVLSNWHWATPLWYLQKVEGWRADVEVRYVYPQGATPNEDVWLSHIAGNVPRRPVIVTNRFYAYERTDYRWIPYHRAWLVGIGPQDAIREEIVPSEASFEGGVHLVGSVVKGGSVTPGKTLDVRVYWQLTERQARDFSSFVQLLGPDGVVGQGDIVHAASTIFPGEMRVDAYRIPLLLHAQPGEYQLITGFYHSEREGWTRLLSEGRDHVALSTVRVDPMARPPATLHPLRVGFPGLRLAGVDFDRGVPGQTRLYLHWWRRNRSPLDRGPWQKPADRPIVVRLTQGGTVIVERMLPALPVGAAATLALDVPDGLRELQLSLALAHGTPVPRLGPWHRAVGRDLDIVLPRGDVRYVPLGGEMALVGTSMSRPVVSPGEEFSIEREFLALRSLTSDYSVSAGLRSIHVQEDGAAYEVKSDGTPALGAIPTLKWIRGWVVRDPRTLTLDADMPAGTALTTIEVYGAFSLAPLGVLDERLVREGQGTVVHTGAVEISPGRLRTRWPEGPGD